MVIVLWNEVVHTLSKAISEFLTGHWCVGRVRVVSHLPIVSRFAIIVPFACENEFRTSIEGRFIVTGGVNRCTQIVPVHQRVFVSQVPNLWDFVNSLVEGPEGRKLFEESSLEDPLESLTEFVHIEVNPSDVIFACQEGPVVFS